MIENNGVSIIDDFLESEYFEMLEHQISHPKFPWYWRSTVVYEDEDPKTGPGVCDHAVWQENSPCSDSYSHYLRMLKQMEVVVLLRIIANLNWRLPVAYESPWHTDNSSMAFDDSQWTTSIYYINTNNGYTELEDGTKVESVKNRLLSFPMPMKHRGVTQTDEQRRLLVNFCYLKGTLV